MAAAAAANEPMILENKWYLLEEERAHMRRPGLSPPSLGLVHLSFEFRARPHNHDAGKIKPNQKNQK